VKTIRTRVEDAMKENKEEGMLIGRENRRKRNKKSGRGKGDGKRKSKNEVKNSEGKRLMERIEENGWEVLNGNKQGDEEGEWTCIGSRGETVINYGVVNEEAWESGKIQNRRESRVGPSRNNFEEAKGRERTDKERDGG
jgi:hypothetical protein